MPARGEHATLITGAELSYDDQFRLRRRRYVIMMGLRIPFLLAAVALYHTPWLAITIIALSIPLPWMAVLVANDRPAKKNRMAVRGTINHEQALPAGSREIVDSDSDNDNPAG